MGLLKTQWQASYEGQPITVVRDELTRGFVVAYDGQTIGTKRWSLIGSGTIEGALRRGDRTVPVVVRLGPFRCQITVDGRALPVTKG